MNAFTRRLLLIALLAPACASAQWRYQEGTHYTTISPAISTGMAPAGRIEVTEVFSYGCPFCFQALPEIRKLKESLPSDAVLNYVHASFVPSEAWPMFQRAYYTARALKIDEATHDAFFDSIWKTGEFPLMDPQSGRVRRPLPTIQDAAAWYAKYSKVTAGQFLARANSPEIEAQMRAADTYIKGGKVPSTPAIVVNGRYLVNSAAAGSWDGVRQVVNFLVAQERARLKLPAPKPKP
jgi:thiol:disulfide interchange protein DsbA